MITGIAYLEFGVRDLDACRHLLVTGLGLDELGHGTGQDGERVAIIAGGSSLLQLHEHAVAVSELADDGSSRDYLEVPGSIQHISFYTQDNQRVYDNLKDVIQRTRDVPLGDGPSEQPLYHSYIQRSLVTFRMPDGYGVQVSESIDPRTHLVERLAFKKGQADAGASHHFQGLDHIHILTQDVTAERRFLGRLLGLEELEHRTETYPPVAGYEEATFGAGMTELEVSQSDVTRDRTLGPGSIRAMGFWTDNVDEACGALAGRGLAIEAEPGPRSPLPEVPRRGFTFRGLGGLSLEIAQRP